VTIRDLFRSDDNQKYRSTDNPYRPQPLQVATTAEEARSAALTSVWIWCGFCSGHWLDNPDGRDALRNHRCTDAAGRDLAEVKLLHAEGAHRARLALTRWSPPPCQFCLKSYPAGASHDCGPRSTMTQVDVDAARFQRQGAAAALAADLQKEAP